MHNLLARHQRYGYYDYVTGNYVLPNGYGQSYGRSQFGDGAYDYFWGNGNVLGEDGTAPAAVTPTGGNTSSKLVKSPRVTSMLAAAQTMPAIS